MSRWRLVGLLALAVILLGLKVAHDTLRPPLVRSVEFGIPGLSQGPQTSLKIALLADIHVAGPDMPPSRVERIVEQVNALKPDLVLIAGDFVSDKRTATKHYPVADAIAPLAGLDAQYGVIAVPGNHDHWHDMPAIAAQLEANGVALLRNQVIERAGFTIGGLDDDFTGRADVKAILAASEATDSPKLVLSHSPDPFPHLPQEFGIMLAGHTHCGQIGWPWGGSPATMSKYGQRYACGIVEEKGNTLVTSGGIGTSVLPLRLFTQPEIWLITLKPDRRQGAAPAR